MSTTHKRTYTAQAWIEGGASSWTTLTGTTEEFTDAIDNTTNGYDSLYLWPEVDFDVGPTDDVECNLYSSPDGTNWDDTPFASQRIDKDTDPNQLVMIVRDPPPYVRAGMVQTGATDSHNVRLSWIGSRWQSD